ncbi:MAG TPA: hypothetical protein VG757_01860 [Devosia sp.]|nr:hypothetical protein [Devosia sp.]
MPIRSEYLDAETYGAALRHAGVSYAELSSTVYWGAGEDAAMMAAIWGSAAERDAEYAAGAKADAVRASAAKRQRRSREKARLRATHYLTAKHALTALEAIKLANLQCFTLNAHVVVSWSTVGIVRDHEVMKASKRLLELLRKWAVRRGIPRGWIWVLERGPVLGLHLHVQLHIPRAIRNAFRAWLDEAVETIAGRGLVVKAVDDKTGTVFARVENEFNTDYQWTFFRYLMKGIDPTAKALMNGKVRNLVDLWKLELEAQGNVSCPRFGYSRSIGATAVKTLGTAFVQYAGSLEPFTDDYFVAGKRAFVAKLW